MDAKKGFILYFDTYPLIERLSVEQRGELLSALFEFAICSAEGPCDAEAVLDGHPNLLPETQMAYRFIAQAIHRDTEKWRKKQQRYQHAAQLRALMRQQEQDELPPS